MNDSATRPSGFAAFTISLGCFLTWWIEVYPSLYLDYKRNCSDDPVSHKACRMDQGEPQTTQLTSS